MLVLRAGVRQIQSCAFPLRGAGIWAVYAGLCTLVHDKMRGGWRSFAGQASLKALIIKDMQLSTWKFLSDAESGLFQKEMRPPEGSTPNNPCPARLQALWCGLDLPGPMECGLTNPVRAGMQQRQFAPHPPW